jgi:hypothetical protein
LKPSINWIATSNLEEGGTEITPETHTTACQNLNNTGCDLVPDVNMMKHLISTLSPFVLPSLQESAENFVALKHRWRWKCAAKEEMRVAERKAATLLHYQGFKHSTNNGSKARSWAWLLRKEKILEVVGRSVNITRGNQKIICMRLCGPMGGKLSLSCVQLELKLLNVDNNLWELMIERLFRCFPLVQAIAGREVRREREELKSYKCK